MFNNWNYKINNQTYKIRGKQKSILLDGWWGLLKKMMMMIYVKGGVKAEVGVGWGLIWMEDAYVFFNGVRHDGHHRSGMLWWWGGWWCDDEGGGEEMKGFGEK